MQDTLDTLIGVQSTDEETSRHARSLNTHAPEVVHFPVDTNNPYSFLLITALQRTQFRVFGRRNQFHPNPINALAWARSSAIIHWHWLNGHYNGRTPLRFLIRTFLFTLALLRARLAGTKMVLTVHNLVPHEHEYRRLHMLANRICGRLMHRLIVHNQASLPIVEAAYGARGKVSVVEHIDYGPALSAPALDRQAARERLGWSTSRRYVLFFGQVRPYKGVSTLVRSATFLPDDVTIVIAGKPQSLELEEELRSLANHSAQVALDLRFIPAEELSYYLWASDVAVFPYSESLASGAAHLALAHDLPIVAPRTPAFAELIELGLATGCLDVRNPKKVTEAIETSLRQNRDQWRDACRRYRHRCSAENVARKLASIYSGLLSRPGRMPYT